MLRAWRVRNLFFIDILAWVLWFNLACICSDLIPTCNILCSDSKCYSVGASTTPHINRWYDLIINHQGVRSAVARTPKQEVVKTTPSRSDVSLTPALTKLIRLHLPQPPQRYSTHCPLPLWHVCNQGLSGWVQQATLYA